MSGGDYAAMQYKQENYWNFVMIDGFAKFAFAELVDDAEEVITRHSM